jgi:hypothetical protein
VSEPQAQDPTRRSTLPRHFVRLVYPFLHDLHRDSPSRARRAFLDGRWQHWWAPLGDDELLRTLDSTYFFLPYLREVLFPETAAFLSDEPRSELTEARDAARRRPAELLPNLGQDGVVHLTLAPVVLGELARGTLRQERGDQVTFEGPFRLVAVDALLFPGGVGFLVLGAQADREPLTARDLNDYLYHLRQIHAPRLEWTLPTWRFAAPPGGAPMAGPPECTARDLIDYLVQELTPLPAVTPPAATLADFLRPAARPRPRWTATREGQVYGQYFRLFAYACLPAAPAPEAPGAPGPAPAWQRLGFESPQQLTLYELATVSVVGETDYAPHPARIRTILDDHLVALWAGWQALVLRDNVVFLGLAPSPFNLEALPHNVESDYFPLYLLALYQKVRLSLLQGELIRRDSRLLESAKGARALWREFVLFTNRFWFSEVTDRQQGGFIYRRFQRGLETLALYDEVSAEARDLEKYYSDREQRWTNSLLFVITFFGLPIGLVVSLFGDFFFTRAPHDARSVGRPSIEHPALPDVLLFLGWLAGALILSLLIYGVWHLRKWRDRR